jgi:hypothetical protein
MKLINALFGFLLILGLLGLLLPDVFGGYLFIKTYKTALQFFLLGIAAFLVLKRVFFYRIKGNINIIRLVQTSDFQQRLLMLGIFTTLLFLGYVYRFEKLQSFDTIMIAILLFYFSMQVIEHSRPSIYLDEYSFSYDDYLVTQWPWSELQQIELENDQLRLIGKDSDFELDFKAIDDIDFVRLDDELQRSVLDGEFSSGLSSVDLIQIIKNHARDNEVNVRVAGENS